MLKLGRKGVSHAERRNNRGKQNERAMEKSRQARKPESDLTYYIVKELDGGGCFGYPTYHVYATAKTPEEAREVIRCYRLMIPHEGIEMKIVTSEEHFLEG